MTDDPIHSDLTAGDVLRTGTTWETMLRRGACKHCPRCGGGDLYTSWFRMRERCPTCGFRFEREEGFFIGAYFINFAVTEGLLFLVIMGFVLVLANKGTEGVSMAVPIGLGLVLAVAGPVVFYPFARTIWSAIDLAMTPLELSEIVDAREHLSGDAPAAPAAVEGPETADAPPEGLGPTP